MRILGIDPGWGGGAALLDSGSLMEAVSFNGKTEADIISAVSGLVDLCNVVYLERVHSMPKQGVASSFKFGWIYGLLRGLTIGRVRIFEVTPGTWQKALGCLSHRDKNVTKAKAQLLFPNVKITHSNSDALLLAYYGHTKNEGAAFESKSGGTE